MFKEVIILLIIGGCVFGGLLFIDSKFEEPKIIQPDDKFLFTGFKIIKIDELIPCWGTLYKIDEQVFVCLEEVSI